MPKILVVDDDPLFLSMTSELLSNNNYTVIQEPSGVNVLKVLKNEQPDLIIMDIIMPDKEGLEAITEIRGVNENVPIIAVSAISNIDYLDMAVDLGANAMLIKPFDKEQLLKSLKEYLK